MTTPDKIAEPDWQAAYSYLEQQYEQSLRALQKTLEAAEGRPSRGAPRFHLISIAADAQRGVRAIAVVDGVNMDYKFSLILDGLVVHETKFGRSNTYRTKLFGAGEYQVEVTVRSRRLPEATRSKLSPKVAVEK